VREILLNLSHLLVRPIKLSDVLSRRKRTKATTDLAEDGKDVAGRGVLSRGEAKTSLETGMTQLAARDVAGGGAVEKHRAKVRDFMVRGEVVAGVGKGGWV
jgi:hypothetical protein